MEGGGAPGGWELGGNAAAAGDESIAVASYLDFLTDDLLGPGGIGGALPQMPAGQLMDSSTLAAVVAAGAIEGQGQRQPRKRVRREPSGHLEAAAADNGSNDDDFDPSDDDDELLSGGSGRKGGGSKRKGPAAAQNKASREKARREKINDRWVCLRREREGEGQQTDSSATAAAAQKQQRWQQTLSDDVGATYAAAAEAHSLADATHTS